MIIEEFGEGANAAQVRHIIEGLLAHFFSLHQTSYHPEDIRWLLEMANLQTHWQATYLMSEIVEVRAEGALFIILIIVYCSIIQLLLFVWSTVVVYFQLFIV